MKKITMISVIAAMAVSGVHAGLWDSLGFAKKSEPTTLAEACNKDDITKICPEIALGQKTIVGCLSDNITSLSKQCANFVKKSIADGKTDLLNQEATINQDAANKINAVKEEAAAKIDSAKADQAARQAEVEAQKAQQKAAAAEAKAAAKSVANDAKETGKALKSLFTE